jgi:hypothetical protein
MQIVPTIILWSIVWLTPVGINGQHASRGEVGAASQRVEASNPLGLTLELANFSIAEAPRLTDLGATQFEEDDLFEEHALDCGPFPHWPDCGHTNAVNHFLPRCDRADSVGRLFSIRC